MADYYDRGYPGGGGGGGGYPGGEPSYMSELLSTDEESVGGMFYQCLAATITPPTFLKLCLNNHSSQLRSQAPL